MSTKPCSRWKPASRPPSSTKSAKDFGMPMGPIELTDVVGLDVSLHVGRVLAEAFHRRVPEILVKLVEQKKLGRKSGEGFYVWRDGKPVKARFAAIRRTAGSGGPADPAHAQRSRGLPAGGGHRRCRFVGRGRDICDRLRAISRRSAAICQSRAASPNVVARLEELAQRYGERFRPDPGWQQFAA